MADDEPRVWGELIGTVKRAIWDYYCPRCKRQFISRLQYATCPMAGCNELVIDITDIPAEQRKELKHYQYPSRFPNMKSVRIRNRKAKYD